MAIIYSYPKQTTPNDSDSFVITDSSQSAPNKNRTKSLTVGDLGDYIISSNNLIAGSGTLNTIAMFTPDGQKIGDSIITQSALGSSVTISGNAIFTSGIQVANETQTQELLVSTVSEFNGECTFDDSIFINGPLYDQSGSTGAAGQVLSSTSQGVAWIAGDTNTTYDLTGAVSGADDYKIVLTGSDGTIDNVNFEAGNGISLVDQGTNTVSINAINSGTVTGTGTPDSITVFKTASEVYTPVNTTAIAGKSFLQKISQTNATIELGASTSFTDLNEGLEIYPNTTHFTTRITPWLEIFAYEDPSANPLNTYDSAYDGSAFIVGKSNTIGDANSSNLAIVGFNNTLKGDKMMVIGQTNVINGTNNTGSLVVGVSNTLPSTATLKNSLIAGQNLGVPAGITATIETSFITGRGNAAQGSISRCIMSGDDNDARGIENSFISGARNEIVNGSNSSIVAGQNNQIGNGNSTNTNNNFIAGENNNLGIRSGTSNNKDSFILGRGNIVEGLLGGAIGSGNQVFSNTSQGACYAIGQNNFIGNQSSPLRNAVAIGTQNNVDNDYEIQIGRGLDTVNTLSNNHVLIGRNNDQNTDYDLSGINCSLVVGASTLGAAASRRNGLVITNKTTGSNEGNVILPTVGKYRNYASEALAIAGGVPLYGLYRNGEDIKIRITP